MTRIVFPGTGTTSLRPDRRAWEIALITRDPVSGDEEHRWFIEAADLDLGNADPASLRIGRFHERHPQFTGRAVTLGIDVHREHQALAEAERLTRGAHLAGAVPNFGAEVLAARMRANGICPSWNYHLIDVEPLAAGWLYAHAAQLDEMGTERTSARAAALREIARPPWNSGELSRAVGVEPDEDGRHTALGDARFARTVYDAVTCRA